MQQSVSQLAKPLTRMVERYHLTIVIVVVALLLCVVVFRLFTIVQLSNEKGVDGYAPVSKTNGTFDQKTIDRVDNLKTTADQNTSLQFPARKSPFVE
jgi:hypothetical protein